MACILQLNFRTLKLRIMNKIKLSILSLGIFFASEAIAQDQKPQMNKEQRMEKHMDQLALELELTAVQKEKMTVLHKESFESRQKVKNDASLDEAGKKAAMKSLKKEKKAEMAEILSDEQAAKLKAMKAERKANGKANHVKKDCHKGKKDCKMKERNSTPAVK